jgi:drug/metabolite transporter (DMT)-like permease
MAAEPDASKVARANAYLLVTAALWGFAFVAQREGMEHIGPFLYNGIRFALGALSILPIIYWLSVRGGKDAPDQTSNENGASSGRKLLLGGLLAGMLLFLGASFQQVGIVSTTAGKAGFITGLYVVLVPIFGLAVGRRTDRWVWTGAAMVFGGLYLLSITGGLSMSAGDFLVLVGAVCWAGHVLAIGWLSPGLDSLKLAAIQYAICSALSIGVALSTESIAAGAVGSAALPILYGGVISVGIAYTLQVVAQKHAHPSGASIILSLEAAFAAIGGWLMLGEELTARQLLGCVLMMGGMVVAQMPMRAKKNDKGPADDELM